MNFNIITFPKILSISIGVDFKKLREIVLRITIYYIIY